MTNEELLVAGRIDELYKQVVGLIYRHIKNRYIPLDREDKIGRCNLVFAKVTKTYNPDKGIKFSTYFSKALIYDLNRYLKEINGIKRKGQIVSIDAEIYGTDKNLSLKEVLSDEIDFEEDIISKVFIEECLKDEVDKKIINLRFKGYNQNNIAKEVHMPQTQVSRRLREIKKMMA